MQITKHNRMTIDSAAASLHHLAVRIGEQRPVAFKGYSLADILCLFKRGEGLREHLLQVFGTRGSLAALKLIQIGPSKLRNITWLWLCIPAEGKVAATQRVYPVWKLLGWRSVELDNALDLLVKNGQKGERIWIS